MANPNDFLLNTDYELDKIILFEEGTFTSSKEFSHKLEFIPLIFGVWSTDKDFYSVNPINGELDSSTEPGYTPTTSVMGVANATTVRLTCTNPNNQALYYRIYGFEPHDKNKAAQATARKARKFVFNTDYNYCKLMRAGTFTQANQIFEHKLGYIPQVIAWQQNAAGTEIKPLTSAQVSNYGVRVTATQIFSGSTISGTIYWRLYYDEA